ncbi:MAG: aspartate carbamoyltransferase catalytic subunit [Opitutales bacterium]|nr:aspartate carbamoyltransferase catalytic subunit [Opitutales bacterium]
MVSGKFLNSFKWFRKDLTNIKDLELWEIEEIMALAKVFKESIVNKLGKLPYQRGKTIVNLFLEPSTRTRNAFEMSAYRLGADVLSVNSSASSITKGETLKDTAKNLEAITADMIIIRHSAAGAAKYLAERLQIPVINAGDGAHAHPTQALLDTFTLREKFGGDLKGKKVTILGDILFSRVARSNICCLEKQGVDVVLSGPSTLVPREFEKMGVKVCHDLKEAVKDADAVMLLRIQHERQSANYFPSISEYANVFGLNRLREEYLKKDAIIMHPGPINRGVEVDTYLADSPRSVILSQVTNGVAVRMAVIHLCLSAASKIK